MNVPISHIFLWNLSYFITLVAFSYCLFCKLLTILKNLPSLFFTSIESIVYGLVFVFGLIWILFLTLFLTMQLWLTIVHCIPVPAKAHTGMQSLCSIYVSVSGADKKAVHTGTERLRTNFVLCSDGSTIVPLTCFPLLVQTERSDYIPFNISYDFLVVPVFGTGLFYLKRSRVNATLQRSTFRNSTERSGTIALPCKRDSGIALVMHYPINATYIPRPFIDMSPLHSARTSTQNVGAICQIL